MKPKKALTVQFLQKEITTVCNMLKESNMIPKQVLTVQFCKNKLQCVKVAPV
jgi:hypothetical protein